MYDPNRANTFVYFRMYFFFHLRVYFRAIFISLHLASESWEHKQDLTGAAEMFPMFCYYLSRISLSNVK